MPEDAGDQLYMLSPRMGLLDLGYGEVGKAAAAVGQCFHAGAMVFADQQL